MGACPERNLHVRLNRRLARPTPFLVPPLRAASRSRPMMRLDMGVDEALSGWSGSRTHHLGIGGTNEAVDEGLEYWVKRHPDLAWYFRTLYERFCLDAHAVCEEAAKIHEGFDPDPRAGPIRAEVRYVCRKVMVLHAGGPAGAPRRLPVLGRRQAARTPALRRARDPGRTRPDRRGVRTPVHRIQRSSDPVLLSPIDPARDTHRVTGPAGRGP